MDLYLMRHAHAVGPDEWHGHDAERPLIAKGRAAAAAVAEGLAREPTPIRAIVSSPYVRALATAEIVGKRLGVPVTPNDALAPGFDLPGLVSALSQTGWPEGIVLVGHEPDIGLLLSALVGSNQRPFTIKKASIARVTLPAASRPSPGWHALTDVVNGATLVWLRTWREMAALAGE